MVRNKAGERGRDDQITKDFVYSSREIGLILRTVGKH